VERNQVGSLLVLTNISKYVHTFTLSIQTTPTYDINLQDMNVNCERLIHHIIRCNATTMLKKYILLTVMNQKREVFSMSYQIKVFGTPSLSH